MTETTRQSVKIESRAENPSNVAIWYERGWTERGIDAWATIAWGPLEAEVWVKAGYTPDQVERLNQLAWSEDSLTRPTMVGWAFTGLDMDWIVLAITAGVTPVEMSALVEERGWDGCERALRVLAALRNSDSP